MDLTKPLFNKSLAGFFIRVPIGLYFVISARLLMQDIDSFALAIRELEVLPDHLATLFGVVIPYLQFGVGVLLIVGYLTVLSSFVSLLLLSSFVYAYGVYPNEIIPFNKDIIWIGAILALLSTGAGAFSIDNFRNKGS